MKLLLIVCVLALAVTPGQAQNPESFRVLDKINGILDRELNVLDGSSQVALRGNMNFMKVGAGGEWTTFADGAKKKYLELKKDIKDAVSVGENKFKDSMVWAKDALDAHPYRWMAFKVGITIITTIICPACTFAFGVAFAAIESINKLVDARNAIRKLPEGLTDEAKAACSAAMGMSTLIMITATAVNIFVPIPLDAGGLIGAGVAEVFAAVDFGPLLETGVMESAITSMKALGGFVKDVIKGAASEKANQKADEMLAKIQAKGAKIGNIDCDGLKNAAAEPADGDADTPTMQDE